VRFGSDSVLVRMPILREDGGHIGTLVLLSDLEEENRRLLRYAVIGLVVLLLSVGLVYLVSTRVQRLISDPILSLSQTASTVTLTRDFGVRAPPGNEDEVGTLIDAFNGMLDQIEHRDEDLRQARDQLEHRVRQRTEELAQKVDELESTEAELRRLATRLEASNRELQDFASVASHDLQEPLRKIQAFGGRLASRLGPALDPESGDYLERMQSATARMQALIDDLLALSRISTQPREMRPNSLEDVVRGVLADLETRIESSGAEVQVGPLPHHRGRLHADAAALPEPAVQRAEVRAPGGRSPHPHLRPARNGPRRRTPVVHRRAGQRHRLRGEIPRPHLHGVPAPAGPRRLRGHWHRPRDLSQNRGAARRQHHGAQPARRRFHVPGHASRTTPSGRSRCWP
jgi:signal transduction histidine kinase